jgi:hypothetical protein
MAFHRQPTLSKKHIVKGKAEMYQACSDWHESSLESQENEGGILRILCEESILLENAGVVQGYRHLFNIPGESTSTRRKLALTLKCLDLDAFRRVSQFVFPVPSPLPLLIRTSFSLQQYYVFRSSASWHRQSSG